MPLSDNGLPQEVVTAAVSIQHETGLCEADLIVPGKLPAECMLMLVEKHTQSWNPRRYLDLTLLFSGQGGAAKSARDMGMQAMTFDKRDCKFEDIRSVVGSLLATWYVHSTVVNGIVWMSPDCDPWLSFITKSTTERNNKEPDIVGNCDSEWVQDANDVALLVSWIIFIAYMRGIYTSIEQPINSMLFKYPCVKITHEIVDAKRVVCFAGALGATSPKPLEFMVTIPSEHVDLYLRHGKREAQLRFKEEDIQPTKLAKVTQSGWVCGTKHMAASKAYPSGLCNAIAKCAHHARSGVAYIEGRNNT